MPVAQRLPSHRVPQLSAARYADVRHAALYTDILPPVQGGEG